MPGTILVIGGIKSGKGNYAEARVLALPGRPVYVATAEPRDEEARARIAAHSARRGTDWLTVREQLDLGRVLRDTDGTGPRLIDSLTHWLSNLMLDRRDWFEGVRELETALSRQKSPVVILTSEVGGGAAAANALSRRFQEAAGVTNQAIAQIADEVVLVVAGQPLVLKRPGETPA